MTHFPQEKPFTAYIQRQNVIILWKAHNVMSALIRNLGSIAGEILSPLDVGIDPSHRKAEKNKASRAQIRVRFLKIYSLY